MTADANREGFLSLKAGIFLTNTSRYITLFSESDLTNAYKEA
jgi:hypothetical protein